MPDPCARRNPLVRSGLTQDGRRRAELGTRYFLPDERDLADLVLFGQRFARHVQYYDAANEKQGDWTAFFESDVTASLAALAKLPVDAFRGFQLDLENWLRALPTRDPGQLSSHIKLAFHLPVLLLQIAGTHHARLPGDHPFLAALTALGARDLAEPLKGLISWYKGALEVPGAGNNLFEDTALATLDYNVAGGGGDQRVRLSSTIVGAIAGQPRFSEAPVPDPILAAIAPGSWAGLYAAAVADPSPYVDAVGATHQRYEQVYDALTYNLLSKSIERLYQGLDRIRREAAAHLKASLESFAGHAPHYGLWLAFLQLFEHARGEMNKFTGRHLDFYFREVLRLGNRAAEPDKVHLLFELAKGVENRLLAAGTLFRAGKDALGRPVSYALERDIVVNRATVAELRGLQIDTDESATGTEQTPLAALAVRSRDGLGEVELAKDDPTWAPFGPLASPMARVGFAVADRKLFLREGKRTIVLRAELKERMTSTSLTPRWIVRLSAEKGWLELTGTSRIKTVLDNEFTEPVEPEAEDEPKRARPAKPGRKTPVRIAQARAQASRAVRLAGPVLATSKRLAREVARDRIKEERKEAILETDPREKARRRPAPTKSRILEITVTLDANDPPIVPLDAKLHGTEHEPGVPVMEVAFDFTDDDGARAFAVLRDIQADRVTLRVGATGLRNLMVVAGGATADVSKPFAPFGAQPRAGASLIVGSSEIFSKPIADWQLDVDWETTYSSERFFYDRSADLYKATEAVLTGGQWLTIRGDMRKGRATLQDRPTRRASKESVSVDLKLGMAGVATLNLNGVASMDGRTAQTLENAPLDARSVNGFVRLRLPRDFGHAAFIAENTRALIAKSGGASYSPSSGVNTNSADQPREPYNPMITQISAAYETPRQRAEAFTFLHPFGVSAGSRDGRLFPGFPFEGALLIGVRDLKPPARLTLLVQVADGSGDPLRPAPKLAFSFLDGDTWTEFDQQDVDDGTKNFTGSGVIALGVPEEAGTVHRLLPSGLHWIRIAAPNDADALNRLLSIDAQAGRASFVDAGNDPAFLETPLPAATIAKLVVPDLALKKIVQPYSSFDGRPAETSQAFTTRVSERLRHKDRATTMFDYESLVLEAFPRLYRVKCLNTTELKRNAQNTIVADNELMPGAVTVITVPWTHGQNARDPLRPYTDQATLTAVDGFLRRRISPFVRLEVQNPKFEEIRVDFGVRFKPEIQDIAFYIEELNKAVVSFLTPWSRPGGGEITFGGKLWKSSIIDFIEEQDTVDYVETFRLYHKVDIDVPEAAWTPIDVEVVEATTARSILVSAARHSIAEVDDA